MHEYKLHLWEIWLFLHFHAISGASTVDVIITVRCSDNLLCFAVCDIFIFVIILGMGRG